MVQRNCKNCGAPIQHSYNHKCPYCDTLYDFNEPTDNVVEVKPEDLYDIHLVDVYKTPIRVFATVFVFHGYKLDKPKVYEYNGNNVYITKAENYVNPPRCGICIEIDDSELNKYGANAILMRLKASGVRPWEIENIEKELYAKNFEWMPYMSI